MIKASNFTSKELERFLALQRVSFEILENTAAALEGGETEREVARALVKRYRAAGAQSFFHLPVVLFGERAGLPGDWPVGKFFPRRRALADGDSVILDAAPIFDGYLVDTSYSFCLGRNDAHRTMMAHLADYRAGVLAAVNRGETFKAIADTVTRAMQAADYEPVHRKHPGQVLGHRAIKLRNMPIKPQFRGFDAMSLAWFRAKDMLATTRLGRRSPLWNALKASDHKPHDGLWLVEPHAGNGSVGAKWEDILVIDDGQARWLDEDPPHVRQWACIARGEPYGPNCG